MLGVQKKANKLAFLLNSMKIVTSVLFFIFFFFFVIHYADMAITEEDPLCHYQHSNASTFWSG